MTFHFKELRFSLIQNDFENYLCLSIWPEELIIYIFPAFFFFFLGLPKRLSPWGTGSPWEELSNDI